MSTQTATLPAPAPAATTPEAPAAKLTTEQLRAKTAAWFDESDSTPEAAAKFIEDQTKSLQPNDSLSQRLDVALEAQDKAQAEAAKTAPKGATAIQKEPEAPAEPEASPKPRKPAKRQERPVLDEDRVAELAARTAAEVVARSQPKPKPEPTPEAEELPRAIVRLHKDYQALEELDPTKKGIADKWIKAWREDRLAKEERVKTYEVEWRKANAGEKYNPDAPEHNQFFEQIEGEPAPTLDVTDDELDEAHEHRLLTEAEKRVAKRYDEKDQEVERRVRNVEAKAEVERVSKEAASNVLTALEVESLDKVDEADRPVYESAKKWIEETSSSAYRVINGLETELTEEYVTLHPTPANRAKFELHMRVRGASNLLMHEMGAKTKLDPESTRDDDGRYYVDPRNWDRVPKAERDQYWTLSATDIIARAEKYIVDEAKATLVAQEKQFELMAKKRGLTLTKTTTTKPAPSPNAARPAAAAASRTNAPSMASDVKTPVGANASAGKPKSWRDHLLED